MNSPYTPEFIESQKQLLLADKVRLETELAKVATYDESDGKYVAKFVELHPGEQEDDDENVDEEKIHDENIAMASDLIKLLEDTNAALKKADAGKYGWCDNCQQYIPEDRLKAYPAAPTCLGCE
ncbi:TraR/DksA C4-type zinc finger protein [Patescibacteria group bacterium]|nr:TraR/DksA C4-type zinc finger protein [Patescibacteria group bacterium]